MEEYYDRGKLGYEAFWQNLENTIEIMYFKEGQIARIARLDKVEGLPQSYRQYEREHGMDLRKRETYHYENNRLMQISFQTETWRYDRYWEYYCFYDGNALDYIEISNHWQGRNHQHLIYQRTIEPVISDWLSPDIRQKLVSGVIETMSAQKITEPVCAVILNYSFPDHFFPPTLLTLLQSERQNRIDDGETSLETLWLPNYQREKNFIELNNPEVLALCYDVEERVENYADARNALAQIARDLISAVWLGKLPITTDFIVYSMSIDVDSATERIMLSAPTNKIEALRAQGLL